LIREIKQCQECHGDNVCSWDTEHLRASIMRREAHTR
jgi:hypothetical protein